LRDLTRYRRMTGGFHRDIIYSNLSDNSNHARVHPAFSHASSSSIFSSFSSQKSFIRYTFSISNAITYRFVHVRKYLAKYGWVIIRTSLSRDKLFNI
jgi:ribosomal protein S26